MKYKVKSKLVNNSRKNKKHDWVKLTPHEQRIANILQHTIVRRGNIEIPAVVPSEEVSVEQTVHDEVKVEINGVHSPTEKGNINVYEPILSTSQYQPIEHTDTQEESQMNIAKSLQMISQQNREILFFIRKTYDLKVEDTKKRQAYQSTKLAMYRRKFEILQAQLEMNKLSNS